MAMSQTMKKMSQTMNNQLVTPAAAAGEANMISAAFPYQKQRRRVLGREMAYVEAGEGDPLVHIQGLEQGVEVAAVLDEAIRAGAAVRQLVGVAHADQVGGDAAA